LTPTDGPGTSARSPTVLGRTRIVAALGERNGGRFGRMTEGEAMLARRELALLLVSSLLLGASCGNGAMAPPGNGDECGAPMPEGPRVVPYPLRTSWRVFTDGLDGDLEKRISQEEEAGAEALGEVLQQVRETSVSSEETAAQIAQALRLTGLMSRVTFYSARPGALVRFRFYDETEEGQADGLTPDAFVEIPPGFYFFWTVRDGRRTSDPLPMRVILFEHGPVFIEETDE
jgi:hypothetical protein